mmetsp:Transcript_9952/g.27100  ORF Transcript_9952/g.27100 Transcript_9952/m.27100 type:complete len:396 (+) Transcript_9952:1392-2579(+)
MVGTHAFPARHVASKHPDDRRALVVRNAIEEAVNFDAAQRFLVRHVKGVRRIVRVGNECILQGKNREELVGPVFRLCHTHADVLDVFRKPLVEEEIVPPVHRHQVAKPHVSKLVSNSSRRPQDIKVAGVVFVHQQARLPVRDEAPVLHGPRFETWNGNKIELLQGEGNTKELLVSGKNLDAAVEGIAQIVCVLRCAPDADGDPPVVHVVRQLHQVSHDKGHEIRAHRWGRLENVLVDRDVPVIPPGVASLSEGRVEQDLEVIGIPCGRCLWTQHANCEVEIRLHVGLIEARKRSSRIRGLHLSGSKHVSDVLRVLVVAAVEAPHAFNQRIRVSQRDVVKLARTDRLLELDHELLLFLVIPPPLLPHLPPVCHHKSDRTNVEVGASVEHQAPRQLV